MQVSPNGPGPRSHGDLAGRLGAFKSWVTASRVGLAMATCLLGGPVSLGCLRVNLNYDFAAQGKKQPTSGSSSSGEFNGTNTGTLVSQTTQVPSPSSSLTSMQSGTSTSTRSSSSSSSSIDLGPLPEPEVVLYPVDLNDGIWREVEIEHAFNGYNVEVGYSLQLVFDHASMVSQGAEPQGGDLALVYVEGQQAYAIDRWVDPSRAWNRSDTLVWFAAQGRILPGETVRGRYYIVCDSSVFNARQEPRFVFPVYDTFEGGQVDPRIWEDRNQALGASSIAPINEGVALSVESIGNEVSARSLVSRWNQAYDGVLAEMRFRVPESVSQPCNQVLPLAFESANDAKVRHGLAMASRDWNTLVYQQAGDTEQASPIDSMRNENGQWHRYALTWYDTTVSVWRDHEREYQGSSQQFDLRQPNSTSMRLRLGARARAGACTGASRSMLEVDWVWLRHYSRPEPQLWLRP